MNGVVVMLMCWGVCVCVSFFSMRLMMFGVCVWASLSIIVGVFLFDFDDYACGSAFFCSTDLDFVWCVCVCMGKLSIYYMCVVLVLMIVCKLDFHRFLCFVYVYGQAFHECLIGVVWVWMTLFVYG